MDLPIETTGSAASVNRTLRPALTYPTLRIHTPPPPADLATSKEPAAHQPQQPSANPEFSDLVAATVGRHLPTFGSELFGRPSDQYKPVDQVNVPADFVIGPGDELHVRAWGTLELDVRITVDRTGTVNLPKIGEITVTGVRYGEIEDHIRSALRRAYRGFELSVTLGRLKAIRVYVTGFAAAPGSYTVSSLSSLINAVFLSGGPSPTGDPRRIELHRGGEVLAVVDLYRFLIYGERDQDVRLQPNDQIHIPALRGQVAVAGSVNQPAIFHLGEGETLADLIAHAGGLSPIGSHRLVLERFDAGGRRVVQELSLTEPRLDEALRPGDLAWIQPISAEFHNTVTLRGHVAQPLRHQWRPGMRISDLLPDTEALVSPEYWRQRNAKSRAADLLGAGQRVEISVDFPDINWSYAALERVDRANASATLIPFHLGKAILERDPEHDLLLERGDILTVFALDDFANPIDSTRRLVRIEGEVTRAGIYSMDSEETLNDLIGKAGGLTENAYLLGLEFSRESVRRQQAKRMHEAINRLDEDYQRHLIDRSRNVLSGDLSLAIRPEADAIQALVSRLRSAEPSGRVVIDLDQLSGGVDSLPPLSLRDEDQIYIPPRPATVEVVGAVLQTGSTLHRPGRKVREYLAQAGVIATADRRDIYLVRPNGSFQKAVPGQSLLPGDTLVVPERVDRQAAVRRLKDWTQVLYQFGLGAAGLAILKDL